MPFKNNNKYNHGFSDTNYSLKLPLFPPIPGFLDGKTMDYELEENHRDYWTTNNHSRGLRSSSCSLQSYEFQLAPSTSNLVDHNYLYDVELGPSGNKRGSKNDKSDDESDDGEQDYDHFKNTFHSVAFLCLMVLAEFLTVRFSFVH